MNGPASGTAVPAPTRLLLTRHGETVWHRENRYAGGASDPELTATGEDQARRLARWAAAAGLDAVVSSPMRRALATAAPGAAAAGVGVARVEDLREVHFGMAEGAVLADLDPEVVARFRDDPAAHPFPGAEPPERAAHRCVRALRGVAAGHPGATVLVVAHNTLLRLGLCALLGLPLGHYRRVFPRLDNAAITEIALRAADPGPPALRSLNVPVTAPASPADGTVRPGPRPTTKELS